jgi:hypothetical protein
MFFDLLGSFFSFDTKAIRSIPRLLFMPGSLTKEYVKGKRQTYLAPFRLYLFVSIVLFLLLPLVVKDTAFIPDNKLKIPGEQSDSTAEHKGPDNGIMEDIAVGFTETLDRAVDSFRQLDPELDSLVETARNNAGVNFSTGREGNFNMDFSDSVGLRIWENALAYIEAGATPEEAVDSFFSEQNRYVRFLIGQGLKMQSRGGEGLVSSLLDVSSYALFFFLPMFALLLKLLYIRRKRYYIEHLIFSLHFYSFFFLMLILFVLTYKFIFPVPIWIVFIIVGIYLYAAMKNVYYQNLFKTFFKWFLLLFTTTAFYMPVFVIIALAISIIFY